MSSLEYSVECKTREELRTAANFLREKLGLENRLKVPVVELLDVLPEVFPKFSYEIVEDSCLPSNIHAETDIASGHVTIKESIYERACDGCGRDRMTIAHEICHFVTLCVFGFKLQRKFGGTKYMTCEDPEWQAKCMAGELLIDKRLVGGMSPEEISEKCGVSLDAARYQYDEFAMEDFMK